MHTTSCHECDKQLFLGKSDVFCKANQIRIEAINPFVDSAEDEDFFKVAVYVKDKQFSGQMRYVMWDNKSLDTPFDHEGEIDLCCKFDRVYYKSYPRLLTLQIKHTPSQVQIFDIYISEEDADKLKEL